MVSLPAFALQAQEREVFFPAPTAPVPAVLAQAGRYATTAKRAAQAISGSRGDCFPAKNAGQAAKSARNDMNKKPV
jgi:hypothetical protein